MDTQERIRYRATKKWKNFRKTVLQASQYTCYLCGIVKKGKASRFLQVHHTNPSAYGNETIEDVQVLCSSCHKETERLLRRKNFSPVQYAENFLTLFKNGDTTNDL